MGVNKFVVILTLAAIMLAVSTSAITSQYCNVALCKDHSTESFHTFSSFDQPDQIIVNGASIALSMNSWTSDEAVDFSLVYDGHTIIYTVGSQTIQYDLDSDVSFINIITQNSNYGDNTVELRDMKLNGVPLMDMSPAAGMTGQNAFGELESFMLEGKAVMHIVRSTNGELPAFSIYVLTKGHGSPRHDPVTLTGQTMMTEYIDGPAEVPEFSVVAASIALVGAAIIVSRKRML